MTNASNTKIQKRTLIANFPSTNWKSRIAVFLGVFGFIWLFLEPLSSFGLDKSLLSILGIGGYLGLFIVSGFATLGYELFQKNKLIGEMDLIPINVVLTEMGTRHYLNTPRHMKTGIFIDKFMDELTYVPEKSILSHREMYDLNLLAILKHDKIELERTSSFADSGIENFEEVEWRIIGQIKPEFEHVFEMAARLTARPVEIVICLDVTGSMGGIINDLKTNLAGLFENISDEYQKRGIAIYDISIKIVAYRDFYDNEAPAIQITPFFLLPNQKNLYQNTMASFTATGGGDAPESSLEALALGIMSEWDKSGDKNQLVVLITDAPPHPLDMKLNSKPENYPKGIPMNKDDLWSLWESGNYIKNSGKKLLLVAPDCEEWETLSDTWTMVTYIDFNKMIGNKESVSSYISKLVADSIIDTQRAA